MFGVVRHCLGLRWSPQQIALTLASIYPKGHPYRVSHEPIYNCIYAQPVGERKRELVACLRQAHNKRLPRSKGQDRPHSSIGNLTPAAFAATIRDQGFAKPTPSDKLANQDSAK